MKITKVDVLLMEEHPQDNPNWSPVLCRVYTDEGIYGDGEGAMAYNTGAKGTWSAIQEYAQIIIGMDPLDHEVIWEKLYKSTFWAQNGGPTEFSAISAIDVALWDIKGKAFGVPVWRLLGGKQRESLRCYASQLQFGWGDHKESLRTIDEYVHAAELALAEGYDCIKYDFFTFDEKPGVKFTHEDTTRLLSPRVRNLVVGRLAAVREAVGPDVDIIVENHSNTDAQSAVQLAHLMEPYDVFYFEEPCTPNPKMNKYVHDHINMPVSQGERLYSRWQYAPYFENGSVQLIQPDLGNCGGITEGKKICDMAHTYDVGVQVHVCSSPLLTAASLQLECVIPNFTIHEHHVYNRFDYVKRLVVNDYQPVNGRFEIPDAPGIGNEISKYAFEHGIPAEVK